MLGIERLSETRKKIIFTLGTLGLVLPISILMVKYVLLRLEALVDLFGPWIASKSAVFYVVFIVCWIGSAFFITAITPLFLWYVLIFYGVKKK
jgi:hypothetical protein